MNLNGNNTNKRYLIPLQEPGIMETTKQDVKQGNETLCTGVYYHLSHCLSKQVC